MSSRRNQAKHRKKGKGPSGATNDEEFVFENASGASGGRNRDGRPGQPSGKAGKRPKQERRRARRQDEADMDQDAFANLPWEELFQSDVGIHLMEVLAGFGRLKTRISNSVPWIGISQVCHEVLWYIDTHMLASDSLISVVLSACMMSAAILMYIQLQPPRWRPVVKGPLMVSSLVLGALAALVHLLTQVIGVMALSTMLKLVLGLFALQLAVCFAVERRSFDGVDSASFLALFAVVQFAYPATVFHGSDKLGDSQLLFTMLFLLAGAGGLTKFIFTLRAPSGSYHRVTLGSSVFMMWEVLIVGVMCRFPYGCVIFHLVCRFVTLTFVDPLPTSLDPPLRLSGDPKFDLLHVLLELLAHCIARGVVWYSAGLVALIVIWWLSRKWSVFGALQALSIRPVCGCFVLAFVLRIFFFMVHWILSWFPAWLTCIVFPYVLAYLCWKSRVVHILSLQSAV